MSLYAAINARLDAKIAMQAELDSLRQQLATLQSQPRLQPVTPEAMAELEGREVIGVLFVDGYGVQVASYNRYRGWWWCGGIGKLDRPTRGWFIELSTIPEVQQ